MRLRQAGSWIRGHWRKAVAGLTALWGYRLALKEFKFQLLTALGIGVSVAVGAWFAGPGVSAVISGAGGFAASLAVQGWLWVRKMMGFSREQIA